MFIQATEPTLNVNSKIRNHLALGMFPNARNEMVSANSTSR